jgi:hypothetical protein
MSSTEQVVKTARCPKCGSEVRDGSLFCYNCGGRVTCVDENKPLVETPPAFGEPPTKPAPGLRSARDIRRRERTFDRKPKEVVWEPSTTTPDLQLIIITSGVIVFTAVVILMVLYLR